MRADCDLAHGAVLFAVATLVALFLIPKIRFACSTVVGTSLCMILVTTHGFRAALLLGAAVYALGFAALWFGANRTVVASPNPW